MCGVPPIQYMFFLCGVPPFATLGSVLDSKQSWKSGKFQLVRWSHRLFFYVLLSPSWIINLYQLVSPSVALPAELVTFKNLFVFLVVGGLVFYIFSIMIFFSLVIFYNGSFTFIHQYCSYKVVYSMCVAYRSLHDY